EHEHPADRGKRESLAHDVLAARPPAVAQSRDVRVERRRGEGAHIVPMLRERDASDHELADLDADRRHADVRPIDRDGVATAIEQILAERIEMTERPRAGLEAI